MHVYRLTWAPSLSKTVRWSHMIDIYEIFQGTVEPHTKGELKETASMICLFSENYNVL